MTQGQPLEKSVAFATLSRKLARRGDTLHILVYVLREQAIERGDQKTVDLINFTLEHVGDGDSLKLYLMAQLGEG